MSTQDETPAAPEQPAAAPAPEPAKGNLITAARKSAGRSAWMGAAAGIGSAAIVAALLYANRSKKS
jgi:hypothetical protein